MSDILLVDDDPDLLEVMRSLLVDHAKQDCVSATSLQEVIAQREAVLGCRLAVIDVNLGPGAPSGVEVSTWLREAGFSGQIVFLTGHALSHPLVAEAARAPGTRVLGKPISSDMLLSIAAGRA
jgi:CheY-like chemotaxis protein